MLTDWQLRHLAKWQTNTADIGQTMVKGQFLVLMLALVLLVGNIYLGFSCAAVYAAAYADYAVENMTTGFARNQCNISIA